MSMKVTGQFQSIGREGGEGGKEEETNSWTDKEMGRKYMDGVREGGRE